MYIFFALDQIVRPNMPIAKTPMPQAMDASLVLFRFSIFCLNCAISSFVNVGFPFELGGCSPVFAMIVKFPIGSYE